jgi:hypothetical protein
VHTYAKRYGVVRYTAYDELTVLGVMPPASAIGNPAATLDAACTTTDSSRRAGSLQDCRCCKRVPVIVAEDAPAVGQHVLVDLQGLPVMSSLAQVVGTPQLGS